MKETAKYYCGVRPVVESHGRYESFVAVYKKGTDNPIKTISLGFSDTHDDAMAKAGAYRSKKNEEISPSVLDGCMPNDSIALEQYHRA